MRRFPQFRLFDAIGIALLFVAFSFPFNFATENATAQVCSVTASPSSYCVDPNFWFLPLSVSASASCSWTATTNAGWLSFPDGASGTGNKQITVKTEVNPNATARTGTVSINGSTVLTVTQNGPSSYSISPTNRSFASSGGGGTVTSSGPRGCFYAAFSYAEWISVTSGTTYNGSATVSYTVQANPGAPRSGVVAIGGIDHVVNQSGGCTYSISPTSQDFGGIGGTGSVAVTAPAGCSWTAASNASWINITSGGSGSGNGTVNYSVACTAQRGGSRTGTLTIAGKTFTVDQVFPLPGPSSCSVTLSPTSQSFSSNGGAGTVSVSAACNCDWSATSNAAWITVNSPASGGGNGSVSYSVAPNSSGSPRSGTITINNQTYNVEQQGINCSYSFSPASATVPAGSGTHSVTVVVTSGCEWFVSSSSSWIRVTSPASGAVVSGTRAITFQVDSNPDAATRAGTIVITENCCPPPRVCIAPCQTHTLNVNQAGATCTYSISPALQSFSSSGGAGSLAVTTAPGCNWTAVRNVTWINITSGGGGNGNGTVNYSVAPNNSPDSRIGTVTIADQTFTVEQTGVSCSYLISPSAQSFPSSGGAGSVAVTAPAGCSWNAASNSSWINITSGGNGSGNGTVSYSVGANPSFGFRTGTITVAGQTFTVSQGSAAPARADLTITNTSSAATVASGTRLSFNLTLFNSGPDAAGNVVVNVDLPAGVTFFSAVGEGSINTPSVGASGTVQSFFNSIPARGSAIITIEVNVLAPAGQIISSTAIVTSSSDDPVPGNNMATAISSVQGGGIVTLAWDQLPRTVENPTPPPANLRLVQGGATFEDITVSADPTPPAEECSVVGYNVYLSGNLAKFVPVSPVLQTQMPTPPSGADYAVTAIYNCQGAPKETAPTNPIGVPGGGSVDGVKVGSKLKINGSGFTDSVEVLFDGVRFSKTAKATPTNIVQKGRLTDGRSLAEVLVIGRTYLITVRNNNGGVASYSYTHR